MNVKKLTKEELVAGLEFIRQSPLDRGELKMIVRRPESNKREILQEGELDLKAGLKGDCWMETTKSSRHGEDHNRDTQITIMNARAIDLLAVEKQRWALAGDQLYVDLNLGSENLPPGSQLEVGEAIVEITQVPHTGCRAFADRYGVEAVKFVNSPEGKKLNLRGVNAKVIRPGRIKIGNAVTISGMNSRNIGSS